MGHPCVYCKHVGQQLLNAGDIRAGISSNELGEMRQNLLIISVNATQVASIRISFCPKCGRDLATVYHYCGPMSPPPL